MNRFNFGASAGAFACLLMVTSSLHAASDLYFSEYVEGSGNNKAVEIFNDTGAVVDLAAGVYQLTFYYNGSPTPGLTIDLAGSVDDGGVFVVASSSANAAIISAADQTAGGGWFNGNDAVVLSKGGAFVDVIGQVGFNPGTEWGTGDTSTQNNTLRRSQNVNDGDTNGADAFDPSLQWLGLPQDIVDGLGDYPDTGVVVVDATIPEIQGAGHVSPLDTATVATSGIVTAVDFNGFYLQDPAGDGDTDTSDAIFVFTSTSPTVSVGDSVDMEGTVTEFIPGGASTNNLSITEIIAPTVQVLSSGNPLPAAVVIGAAGRVPPTDIIDNDAFAVFDPDEDGIDFFETLEAMRVTVDDAVAVSRRNRFNEITTVADLGAGATGINTRGGITISPTDFNPEKVQIQLDGDLLPGFDPTVSTGDQLGDVTGVVSYGFGLFEVLATDAFTVTPGGLAPEITTLLGTASRLTIASYNVLNLDPKIEDSGLVNGSNDIDDDVGDGRFDAIAASIVTNMASPDIIGLQEIQDNDGAELTGVVDASLTYQTLVDAIIAAGGPTYAFADLPPVDLQDGGQPGGNIRVGYLYNPARVSLVGGSLARVLDTDLSDGDANEDSRKPLSAVFDFNGVNVQVINVHFRSKGGSSPLFGQIQPPINGNEDQRAAQAQVVNDLVDSVLATDPDAAIVVLGDVNEFDFLPPLDALTGEPAPVLTNLTLGLPVRERYTFEFQGNSQSLDHILVTNGLASGADFDIVHVNSEFATQATDHEPLVARLTIDTEPADTDADGIVDTADNCPLVANADQRDTNGDLIGNVCDADANNDCSVNFGDLALLKAAFFPNPADPDLDFDGNGFVNFGDLATLKSTFFNTANPGPGPGAPGNACE